MAITGSMYVHFLAQLNELADAIRTRFAIISPPEINL